MPPTANFFQWADAVDGLKAAALQGDNAALHKLFLMSAKTDGAMVDVLGGAYLEIKRQKPKWFRQMLKKETKETREAVRWHLAAAS